MNAESSSAQRLVLLVEDSPGDARLIQEYLAEPAAAEFALEQVGLLSEGLDRLARGGVAVVLLDLSLPDSIGLETFAKAHACAPDVPIIVMSGLDDEALAIKTVHEGAQDYLVKLQVDSRLLVRTIRYAIERKRAEEALAKERDLFHTLLDNLPDRIYFKDDQSRFIRINQAVADQFKLAHPRDVWGKTDRDFFTAEHAQSALADEQRLMRTGEPLLGKVEKETLPDGTVTWALTSKLPYKDKQGRIVGNFGISRDITALKKIEDQLEAERNLLRSLIDNLPDYIYVKDAEGRYLLDNIAHRQLLGVKAAVEVIGRTVTDFFPPELAARYSADDQQVFATGEPLLNHEEPIIDRAGQRRWNATTKVPLRDAEGRMVGLVCIGRDITERKLSEEQLQQANTELARSKGELQTTFAELQHSHAELKSAQFQLIQAEKMQSVGRLAAGVAHEVKNPLAILEQGVDYLARNLPNPDESTASILGDMKDAIKRADSIILGLLDFSVPHALNARAEDLSRVVEQSLAFVRHLMADPPVQLVKDLAPGLPSVWIDPNKIKQVFINLLTNAIHAMPAGGTLTVRTYARTLQPGEVDRDDGLRLADRFRAGETVVIAEVADTGTGVPGDKLARIFDPFFTTKPAGKGTGLGLTVTKKIIELHGGSIDLRNRPEVGVLVTITFKV